MPSKRIQQNPAERGYSLDFELRGDAAILPAFDGVLSHFKRDLQAQEVVEERRTMYVALTRARRSLHVSGSQWYGELVMAKGPSEFFAELADWGAATGEATLELAEGIDGRGEPDARLPAGARAALARPRQARRRGRALRGRMARRRPSTRWRRAASSPRCSTRSARRTAPPSSGRHPRSASSPRTCASARPPSVAPASRARRRRSR